MATLEPEDHLRAYLTSLVSRIWQNQEESGKIWQNLEKSGRIRKNKINPKTDKMPILGSKTIGQWAGDVIRKLSERPITSFEDELLSDVVTVCFFTRRLRALFLRCEQCYSCFAV